MEYSISKRGKKAIVIIEAIRNDGLSLMKDFGVNQTDISLQKKK